MSWIKIGTAEGSRVRCDDLGDVVLLGVGMSLLEFGE